MTDAVANPRTTDSVESRLRLALEQGDAVIGSVPPVLRHLLTSDDSGLFADAIVARVRGMITDVARQLLGRMGGAEDDLAGLAAALTANPAFLTHVHTLVLEWQLTERLQARLALDPVLSPLLQALIASSDETTAALAMKLLAAQARFGQAQRRMRLPLAELPGDLLHSALIAMRGVAGAEPEADLRAAAAEAAIRAEFGESRSRLGLISRLVTGMGGGAVAALSIHHAGAAIFLSTLAIASGQDREVATLATSETQRTRFALALCAAGLKPAAIEEQLLALDPDAALPEGLERLSPDRAAALIAGERLTMTASTPAPVRAISDGADCLVSADKAIAALQLRCGGELPGTIAVPALLEVVRKARRYGLRLARTIQAQDGASAITAWVEVEPLEGEDAGCEILLRNWQSTPLAGEDAAEVESRRAEIDRHFAELTARLDARQRVLTVEAEAADLAAVAAAMEAGFGRPWTDFVRVAGSNHHQPMHWRLLDGAEIIVPGSNRSWRASLFPQQGPGQEPTGFELCLVSQELPLAAAEAPHAGGQAARDRLVARDIAPVLRQPIARIIANAETIRSRLAGPLADDYANYAADIAAAGQHLLALVDDLTDLEVVEADDFSTVPDHIDLADVARQAAGILGVRAREKRITLDAPRAGESLPAVAEFRRVLQVLINLISNAIRYSPEDSQVWIRLEDEDGRARVIVADQGPGLSEADQARVFEKFERLGRSGDGGSGLGLYISRRLARAMGGDLTVEAAPGQGARFILEVPVDIGASAPAADPDQG